MSCLNTTPLVYCNVDDDRTVGNVLKHLLSYQLGGRRAWDQHSADDQIGLRNRILDHVSARR